MGAQVVGTQTKQTYIGRFAPSPTGPLHYGSLIAAVASYLQAKQNHGQWLIRIEDIDPSREAQGAADDILRTLELYQFEWSQAPLYQSTRYDAYRHAVHYLKEKTLIYACACSRKQIGEHAQKSVLGRRYPGTCQTRQLDVFNTNYNLRLRAANKAIRFSDQVFGEQNQNLFREVGDFIIHRKFDLPTYALAVTVDDAYQGITEVVRGHDLLAFTPLQIYLCEELELLIPDFLHIPIVLDGQGHKLSKQSGAQPLLKIHCSDMLAHALKDLGQDTPQNLAKEKLETIWQWAWQNWQAKSIPKTPTLCKRPFL